MTEDRILRPVELPPELAELAWRMVKSSQVSHEHFLPHELPPELAEVVRGVVKSSQVGYDHFHNASRLRAAFEEAAKPEPSTVAETEQAFSATGETRDD